DPLVFANARNRATYLHPPAVEPWRNATKLAKRIVAVFFEPEAARHGIEVEAEGVANAVGKDPLDVSADLAAHCCPCSEERVICLRRPVVVQAEEAPGEVVVAGRGPAELIVRNRRTRADCSRPARQISHPAAPAVVADHNVELAIRPELDYAAVVVAAQ